MSVIIGSARIDENGHIIGGAAGDQTGREVCVEPYYRHSLGWVCIRPKDATIGIKISTAMMQACSNNHIGYDQGQRESIVPMYKKYGSLKAIKENCETDCSKLVAMCVLQATGKDPGWFSTANAVDVLGKTGLFEKPFNVTDPEKLCVGDILCTKTKGHIVVVTAGKSRTVTSKKETNGDMVQHNKYRVTTALNIRADAGVHAPWLGTLSKGTITEFLGEFKVVSGTKWYKVKSKGITGWVSSKYLKKA